MNIFSQCSLAIAFLLSTATVVLAEPVQLVGDHLDVLVVNPQSAIA